MWRTLLFLPLLSACSLEELTEGSPDASVSGGSAGIGGQDAGADVATGGSAGSAGIDAGEDAGSECGGRGDGYCATLGSSVELCADFDQGLTLPAPFSSLHENNGSVSVQSSAGCNGSNAAAMSLPSSPPGCSYATLVQDTTGNFKSIRLSADVMLGDAGTGANFSGNRVLSIQTEATTGTDCRHFVFVQPTKTTLHTQRYQQFDDTLDLALSVPLGEWTRVELVVETSQSKAKVSVFVGGVEALAPTVLDKCGAGSNLNARVGIFCESDGMSMLADNVVIDTE